MASDACGMIEKLLQGNQMFRDTEFAPNIEHYQELSKAQKPTTLWISCADSRMQVGHITQAPAGELFIMRNVGNIVPVNDPGIEALLEFALVQLNISHVVVCGHSKCASVRALDWEPADGAIPHWLDNAREARTRVDARIFAPVTMQEKEERYKKIEQENVLLQIEHLCTYPLLRQALWENRAEVHGLYYDLATGELNRVKHP
jgi:carbonic anhydrase